MAETFLTSFECTNLMMSRNSIFLSPVTVILQRSLMKPPVFAMFGQLETMILVRQDKPSCETSFCLK